MEIDDSKYSRYMEYGYIKSILRRKYKLSYIEAFRTCEHIKPIHNKLAFNKTREYRHGGKKI